MIALAGNNLFYEQLHEKEFSLFAPTIKTSYKHQNPNLKKELINHMVHLFGQVFNQKVISSMVGKYLKIVWDTYHTNMVCYPLYEHPSLVPKSEWDALVEDSKEKKMKKEGMKHFKGLSIWHFSHDEDTWLVGLG
jgi:hypothetical protein